MKELNYKDSKGNIMNVSVVGCFSIPELEKEFIMYSLVDDDTNNKDGYILLGEVVRDNEDVQILGIESEEKDLVLAYYNEVSKQLGGNKNG